jgi:LDH2 family malate/lactate/ureidoglycolate dehydrogenase
MQTFSHSQLFQFCYNIFLSIGCNNEDATTASNVLLSADLRGIDSHGIARLSGYVRLWEAKRINTTPSLKMTHQTPSTAVVDADAALGLVAAPFAMQIAIEKA